MRHLWVRVLLPLNCILPFIFFFFHSKLDFLYSHGKTGPRLSAKRGKEGKKSHHYSPSSLHELFQVQPGFTDCPPHSATSPLLLHDLLPLIPFPLFLIFFLNFFLLFSFSVPVYMLLICFIY